MAARSFEINNSRSFYNKVIQDYNSFMQYPESSGLAINISLSSWHLSEWLYYEYTNILGTLHPKVYDYQNYLRKLCPELEIMRSIANGSKHCAPPGGNQKVQGTGLHEGAFSRDFSLDFDVTHLYVLMDDNSEVAFETALGTVIEFWKVYLVAEFSWVLTC